MGLAFNKIERRARWLIGGLALCLAPLSASAQDFQLLSPVVNPASGVVVETTRSTPTGQFVPSLAVPYGNQPLVVRTADGRLGRAVIEDQWGLDLLFAYGLADGVQLGLKIPLGHVSGAGLDDPMGGDTVQREAGFGIGDIRFTPKYTFLGDDEGDTIGLSMGLEVRAPTGMPSRFMGATGFSFAPTVAAEARLDDVVLTANLGYRYRLENDVLGNVEYGDVVAYGVSMLIGLDYYALELIGEVFGNRPVEPITDRTVSRPMEGLLGLRYRSPFGGIFTLAGGIGVQPDPGVPESRVMLSFTWDPKTIPWEPSGIWRVLLWDAWPPFAPFSILLGSL